MICPRCIIPLFLFSLALCVITTEQYCELSPEYLFDNSVSRVVSFLLCTAPQPSFIDFSDPILDKVSVERVHSDSSFHPVVKHILSASSFPLTLVQPITPDFMVDFEEIEARAGEFNLTNLQMIGFHHLEAPVCNSFPSVLVFDVMGPNYALLLHYRYPRVGRDAYKNTELPLPIVFEMGGKMLKTEGQTVTFPVPSGQEHHSTVVLYVTLGFVLFVFLVLAFKL